MLKKIKHILKELYIKISCALCCKSNCQVQIGKDNQ